MNIFVRLYGPEMIPRHQIALALDAPVVRDAAELLRTCRPDSWKRVITHDLRPAEGYTILLNGRNILSLDGLDTPLSEGDELIFTVLVMGG